MKVITVVLVALYVAGWVEAAEEEQCVSCLKVRVGRPLVVRDGSNEDGLDTKFYVIKTLDGQYRGYSSGGGRARVITGPAAWSMGWSANSVMEAGASGSASECGVWINSPIALRGEFVAAVHQEQACDYINGGQTHKSMGVSFSYDGVSWVNPVTIIASSVGPRLGQQTGEGDCSLVRAPGSSHLYIYCLRALRWDTIVARAPVSSYMSPGSWKKFSRGQWGSPGVYGDADSLGVVGHSVGYLRPHKMVFLLDLDPWFGGVKMSLSSDYVNFKLLSDPLIPFSESNWNRERIGQKSDLVAYVGVVNYAEGGNNVDGAGWGITYTYIPHGGRMRDKFLVYQDVSVEKAVGKKSSVGLALTRWENKLNGKFRTTTFPVVDQDEYLEGGRVAYVLTRRPALVESVELEECRNTYDIGEYLLTGGGDCAGTWHERLGTVGWLYKKRQSNTVPVYRCYSSIRQAHFASNNSDCDGIGEIEYLLGYGMKD
ncbi:hypothetical protein LMK08_15560 [Metapseudomonas furukawaii]|uniref:hypothetical protein n=1 Tax=Metapseudomonas furukawaii TaxID=1149133 RepID=UPI002279FF20|nr:hypothetical protein [Pseudomonas furukawaii]WAG76795.1 hypothetical protein LMK08_15560 [Pseudomonas furukawaii]